MTANLYRHKQSPQWFPWMILGFLGIILAVYFTMGWHGSMWVACGATVLLGVLFYGLSVEVSETAVRLSFGVGIIHRTIPRERIASVEKVRNSWWYGWGIRLSPHGWLWNIAGLDAIQLTYTNGKKFRIGTDDATQLLQALQSES